MSTCGKAYLTADELSRAKNGDLASAHFFATQHRHCSKPANHSPNEQCGEAGETREGATVGSGKASGERHPGDSSVQATSSVDLSPTVAPSEVPPTSGQERPPGLSEAANRERAHAYAFGCQLSGTTMRHSVGCDTFTKWLNQGDAAKRETARIESALVDALRERDEARSEAERWRVMFNKHMVDCARKALEGTPGPSSCVCPFPRSTCPRCGHDCDACRRGELDIAKGRGPSSKEGGR